MSTLTGLDYFALMVAIVSFLFAIAVLIVLWCDWKFPHKGDVEKEDQL